MIWTAKFPATGRESMTRLSRRGGKEEVVEGGGWWVTVMDEVKPWLLKVTALVMTASMCPHKCRSSPSTLQTSEMYRGT